MNKILFIAAHPDDEILWFWPLLQDSHNKRGVLCISDNSQKYGQCSKTAFLDVAEQENWQAWCGDIPSGFSRLSPRYVDVTLTKQVAKIYHQIYDALDKFKPNIIFTHNPVGEYSHTDHKLVAELVYTVDYEAPIWFTDICLWNKCHVSYPRIPPYILRAFYKKHIRNSKMNKSFFERCSKIYRKYSAWSWGNEIVSQCQIFELLR